MTNHSINKALMSGYGITLMRSWLAAADCAVMDSVKGAPSGALFPYLHGMHSIETRIVTALSDMINAGPRT